MWEAVATYKIKSSLSDCKAFNLTAFDRRWLKVIGVKP